MEQPRPQIHLSATARSLVSTETQARGQYCAVLTQVVANNHIHFDTLANDKELSSEEYAAMISNFIEEFENRIIEFLELEGTFNSLSGPAPLQRTGTSTA